MTTDNFSHHAYATDATGHDITYEHNGQLWVKATSQGEIPSGISTFATPGVGKNWWKLDLGTDIPPELRLLNDYSDHWVWEPSETMPMDLYKAALRLIGASFYRVG
ncbi:hypothetical protein [Argonema antarcticum]|uniref:Tse2 family ADP-ribosyltransferase toxin n=1 Tax=Argonema antarcticum TaxID=2942763 RepID=UPI0020133C12|nr:hypothetical protein [Argonema antarcticum]MCL1472440.1 hypothetical protein [Argonema antarcticum A004/B2]